MAHGLRALWRSEDPGVGRRHAHHSAVAQEVGSAVQRLPVCAGQRDCHHGPCCPQAMERWQVRLPHHKCLELPLLLEPQKHSELPSKV